MTPLYLFLKAKNDTIKKNCFAVVLCNGILLLLFTATYKTDGYR